MTEAGTASGSVGGRVGDAVPTWTGSLGFPSAGGGGARHHPLTPPRPRGRRGPVPWLDVEGGVATWCQGQRTFPKPPFQGAPPTPSLGCCALLKHAKPQRGCRPAPRAVAPPNAVAPPRAVAPPPSPRPCAVLPSPGACDPRALGSDGRHGAGVGQWSSVLWKEMEEVRSGRGRRDIRHVPSSHVEAATRRVLGARAPRGWRPQRGP